MSCGSQTFVPNHGNMSLAAGQSGGTPPGGTSMFCGNSAERHAAPTAGWGVELTPNANPRIHTNGETVAVMWVHALRGRWACWACRP